MVPPASINHSSSGRLRVKITSKKGDGAYFAQLKSHFVDMEGIASVETNPHTGSVLFLHRLDTGAIAERALERGLFHLKQNMQGNSDLHAGVTDSFSAIDGKVREITSGNMNAGAVAAVALVGLGVYQISKGNFAAPAWYTAFWYAFNIFLKSKPEKEG